MISSLLRLPHGFVRRHLSSIERLLSAAVLAFFLYQLLVALPAYPSPWEIVIVTAVFLVTLWSPPVAYFLAVLAAAYPIYTLSIYLAALFLAVAMLGQRAFIENLGATLLVLAIPWLVQSNLAWALPLLGGLWWGKSGGAWIGGLAALWGQLLFGMMGLSPDWVTILSTPPAFDQISARFATANSMETLLLIVEPIGSDATMLLYHLLQVILWAMAAGLSGGLAERSWFQQHKPMGNVLLSAVGASTLAVGHFALIFWLKQVAAEDISTLISLLAINATFSILLVGVLEIGRDILEHPLPSFKFSRQRVGSAQTPALPPRKAPQGPAWTQILQNQAKPAASSENPAQSVEATSYPPLPVPEELPKRDSGKKKQNDDLIKIELE